MNENRNLRTVIISMLLMVILAVFAVGCSRDTLGGAALGAGAAGAAYEYSNKRQMDKLREDYEAGNINQEEYELRKQQIEEGSIIY